MSKIESGHSKYIPGSFNLFGLLADIESMFRLKADAKQLYLRVDKSDDLPEYVVSDENKVDEILINLVGNALKFTQEGGITIKAWKEGDPHGKEGENILLHLDIEDTGVGIPQEEIDSLFEKFTQLDNGVKQRSGTGLGLSISRSHARLMGGDIYATSEKGVGSCFHVVIPVTGRVKLETAGGKIQRRIIRVEPTSEEIRALIVDDNFENRMLLATILDRYGISTQNVESGKKAVESAQDWKPNLIFMDLRMPVMDGYEAAKIISSSPSGRNIPIVAITASILSKDDQKLAECGFKGYISKPFKEEEISNMLIEQLGEIFRYTTTEKVGGGDEESVEVGAEEMAKIPAEILDQIVNATQCARIDELTELIGKVNMYSPPAAKRMAALADGYQYEILLKLLNKS
jgi:CheY-like chemotaxis protein